MRNVALDVLTDTQRLASTTSITKHGLCDEVSAKVRLIAEDMTTSEQGPTGSFGTDESKGFFF